MNFCCSSGYKDKMFSFFLILTVLTFFFFKILWNFWEDSLQYLIIDYVKNIYDIYNRLGNMPKSFFVFIQCATTVYSFLVE